MALDGHHHEVLAALRDRINIIHFDPTDEMIIALIFKLADEGVGGIDPKDARMVAIFLIDECKKRMVRPSVRLYVDKALKDFQLWEDKKCEAHWRDLIASSLEQAMVELQHERRDLSHAEQIDAERRVARDIYHSFSNGPERVAEWNERTGKARATFFRRLKELKSSGELTGK